MYVCMYVCRYVCIYIYIYTCTYVHMYVCMYVCMYVRTYVCMYIYIYIYMYICIDVYVYIYIYIYTHVYAYTYPKTYPYIYIYMYMYIYIYIYIYIPERSRWRWATWPRCTETSGSSRSSGRRRSVCRIYRSRFLHARDFGNGGSRRLTSGCGRVVGVAESLGSVTWDRAGSPRVLDGSELQGICILAHPQGTTLKLKVNLVILLLVTMLSYVLSRGRRCSWGPWRSSRRCAIYYHII